jgi:quercetin dioxygenase-like cupin family protein
VVVPGVDRRGVTFQRDDEDVQTRVTVHDGAGVIQISRLFRDRLTIPVQVQIWKLEPGASEGDHTHPSDDPADNWEELYYVLSGTGTITIDDEPREIAPGDAILVPAGVDHGLYASGEESLRILLIFGRPAT